MRSSPSTEALRQELELRLSHGRCAYCGARASLGRPLTREHLIPRSKGGRRHDPRIIVPACARCNHRRGCQELVLFLLSHPRRISALVDHLESLPAEPLQHVDTRVFAELYAALWVLAESAQAGPSSRSRLRQLCAGRTVHRRRYAARRMITAVGGRIRQQQRGEESAGLACRIPPPAEPDFALPLPAALELIEFRLLQLLAGVWGSTVEEVAREVRRRMAAGPFGGPAVVSRQEDVEPIDSSRSRTSPRRLRVDRRRGRSPGRRAA